MATAGTNQKARDVYMLSSRGEYDILKAANLPELEKLLASLDVLGEGRQ